MGAGGEDAALGGAATHLNDIAHLDAPKRRHRRTVHRHGDADEGLMDEG